MSIQILVWQRIIECVASWFTCAMGKFVCWCLTSWCVSIVRFDVGSWFPSHTNTLLYFVLASWHSPLPVDTARSRVAMQKWCREELHMLLVGCNRSAMLLPGMQKQLPSNAKSRAETNPKQRKIQKPPSPSADGNIFPHCRWRWGVVAFGSSVAWTTS